MIWVLYGCASMQVVIAALNLALPRILGWQAAIAAMPLLVREVFHVHSWFISATLVIFAVLTFACADAMTRGDTEAAMIAWCVAAFWALRVAIQLFYYSGSHHHGRRFETFVHWALLLVYGGMAASYAIAVS